MTLVQSGTLRRGSRVPSIAELTRALDVGKNTVVLALSDLCGDGMLESRERLGFFVRSAPVRQLAKRTRIADLRVDAIAHGMATILVQNAEGLVTVGSGTTAESVLATNEWRRTLGRFEARDPERNLRYADPLGEPRLRDAIAARLGNASPDHVVVTYGAIEALNHAFAVTAAATGSRRIGVESPGYFMIPSMLARARSHRSSDSAHRSRSRSRKTCAANVARSSPLAAMMINPNHHNPTGKTLSLSERFELAALAQEKRFFVIEDDVYKGALGKRRRAAERLVDAPRAHALRELVFENTRSRFACRLRRSTRDARRRDSSKKFVQTLTGDAYTQNLVAEFVGSRSYDKHLKSMRGELLGRARGPAHHKAPRSNRSASSKVNLPVVFFGDSNFAQVSA